MTRVVATLETHYPLGVLRKNIDDLTLSFISPLSTHNYDRRHASYPPVLNTQ
jgi:hypothetical protein